LTKHARLAEHLRFAGLEETFIMESGDVLEIDNHGARKGGRVPVGRVCIDSGSVDDVVEEMVIRDRRHLSEDGIVLPIIAINRQTGRVESPRRSSAAASPWPETAREFMRTRGRWWPRRSRVPTRRRRPIGAS
jgi:mRNA degradation ribonuclease J1/J2